MDSKICLVNKNNFNYFHFDHSKSYQEKEEKCGEFKSYLEKERDFNKKLKKIKHQPFSGG